MNIEYAKNPIWNDAINESIFLTVKFLELADELPFTATPYDDMSYGVELFNNAVAGMYGAIAPYVPPPVNG